MALDTKTFFGKRLYTTNMGYQNNYCEKSLMKNS